jgi:hypothetical protein
LLISGLAQHPAQFGIAVFNSLINFIYAMMITSVSTLSIEGYVSWILLPLMFAFKSEVSFFYMLQTMRYFFLIIFSSAALWKIRAGGIFNIEQMSAILLKQHTSYLLAAPNDWFSRLLKFLISSTKVSWCLYMVATIAELFFVIGFFTKKYDRLLLIIFILFLIFDFFIMRINYMSWFIFTATLWYTKYTLPQTRLIKLETKKIISTNSQ